MRATGAFEVKLMPLASYAGEASQGRMSIDKVYQGDLEGVGKGEMLTAVGAVEGSAVYVATERVSGALKGKTGSFSLYHASTMTRGVPAQTIAVAPDSGSDELMGLRGAMTIVIRDGKHFYEFEYEFAPGV